MLNRLKSFVSSSADRAPATGPTLPAEKWVNELKAQVPVSLPDECDGCDTGFGEGVDGQAIRVGGQEGEEEEGDGFPAKFGVDYDSEMLGSTKPMHRLALISSSKSDWPRDISSDQDSLAFYLESVTRTRPPPSSSPSPAVTEIPGVYQTSESGKLSVLASSVEPFDDPTEEDDTNKTSVLVFPDFKVVSNVNVNKPGAQRLYDRILSPTVGLAGASTDQDTVKDGMESWVLPYRAVVLLCSHKTRDKKCHIAANLLEQVISSTLSIHGYTADTTGESLHDLPRSERLESIEGGDQAVKDLLRKAAGASSDTRSHGEGSKEVGVFKISHLGGHRYAGVMIICFPSGSILYYGRVTPKACVDVVEKTILRGQVLPEHLRGGGNLRRDPGKTLLDW
ncbi:Thioredoxin-like fold [Phaffia rhodozyma]|uniref:Thioredoxin-like fold n=1 Tax=Phaffia rhodozyma TaxID=264483 RepID=A0A0F7SG03_PHARH|nr:Thioredoxin-like fold [Phaffia rhodozyma]